MALIKTTRGLWPEEGLERRDGVIDNDSEHIEWVEYYLGGDLVHRSAHVHLKQAMFADGIAAEFPGGD